MIFLDLSSIILVLFEDVLIKPHNFFCLIKLMDEFFTDFRSSPK